VRITMDDERKVEDVGMTEAQMKELKRTLAKYKDVSLPERAVKQCNFRYYRYGRTNVTVCIHESNAGIAVCSPRDKPNKDEGTRLARGRMLYSLEQGLSNMYSGFICIPLMRYSFALQTTLMKLYRMNGFKNRHAITIVQIRKEIDEGRDVRRR